LAEVGAELYVVGEISGLGEESQKGAVREVIGR